MKMFDKVNIEINCREALRVYLVLSRVNGPCSTELWSTLKDLVDFDGELYDMLCKTVSREATLDYNSYYRPFEDMVFGPKKTPEQIQLETVMQSIAELQEQANTLKEIIENK